MRTQCATGGPRPSHSRDEVVAAAVRIADAEGLDAVSMRRVADDIGVGPSSLYRYISSKDDMIELMIDAALAVEPPAVTENRRADLRAFAYSVRETTLSHPWIAPMSPLRPSLGPNGLRWMEQSARMIDGLGLSVDEMLTITGTVMTFVRGSVLGELAEREAIHRSGLDTDQWMAALGAYGRAIITSGAYPMLSRIMIDARGPHDRNRHGRGFALGLDFILDGLAASLVTRWTTTPAGIGSKARKGGSS
jgi:AcrR family transcriptional regulator